MPLSFGSEGTSYTVKKIGGNASVKQHLNELGFNVGSPVIVVSMFNGNLIVKVKDSRLAIDRAIASHVIVA